MWERGAPHLAGGGVDQGKLYRGCCSSNSPGGVGRNEN